jgi:uncharacterized HAD superfamily protein
MLYNRFFLPFVCLSNYDIYTFLNTKLTKKKMKIKIGVDIDDTIANQTDALNEFLRETRGWKYDRNDYFTQFWPDVWKVSFETALQIDSEFKESHIFLNLEPIRSSLPILKTLSQNADIIFITSRPISCEKQTRDWLSKHCSFSYQVYFSGDPNIKNSGVSKGKLCQELGISVFIDDQYKNAEDCVKHGIRVLLHSAPWNTSFSYPNVYRFTNWEEVPGILSTHRLQ